MEIDSGAAESRAEAHLPMLGAPTASGKSALALRLAQRFPIEVLTADAMQVYRGMDIGTAKPSPLERAGVPHHLLDLVTPREAFSVADWVREAEAVIAEVLARGNLPFVVGGTGFYLQALREGLPTVPPASEEAQAPIWRELERNGIDLLLEELARANPRDAERAERNPRRVVRAVEIVRRTGRAASEFPRTRPAYRFSLAVLEPPLERLRPRILERCRAMFSAGLVDEVRELVRAYPERITATQAIGYKEVVGLLEDMTTGAGSADFDARAEEAFDAVYRATVRYARRQLTWFRRQRADLRLAMLADEAYDPLAQWMDGLQRGVRGPAESD